MEENAKSEEESFKTPGERIVKLCEKQQISQRELARRIGVTSSQISRILKGETKTINSDIDGSGTGVWRIHGLYSLNCEQSGKYAKCGKYRKPGSRIKGHGGTQGTAVSHADASDEFCFSAWRLHRFY